jgi:acyl-CoA synthetase (AMP-forming)/AMP-acid ligase II
MVPAEVNGVPMRLYKGASDNLSEIFERAARNRGDRPLAAEDDRVVTTGEAVRRARRLGAALQTDYGVRPGDRVGIVSRNRPEYLIAFMAVTRIGAVAVLYNSRSAPDEIEAAARDVPCKIAIADEKRAALLRRAGLDMPIIEIGEDGGGAFGELVSDARPEGEAVAVAPEAPAAILFTSGTTGRPKGAVLTQRNMCHKAYSVQFMMASGLGVAARMMNVDVATLAKTIPPKSLLLIFPLFHVSGLTTFLMALQEGGLVSTMRRWNAVEAMNIIEKRGVSYLTGPALVLVDLLDQPNASQRLAHIVNAGVGGQATPSNLSARLSTELPNAQPGNAWGMTELSGTISAASGALYRARPGSCGPVSPVLDVCTADGAGNLLPPGEIGELWVRGPMVMSGYWNAPDATAAALTDGWMHSGDIGRVDEDGFVHLIDRKKDMVICAGENIYCAEVERVLSGLESLAEVALFGVPDERLGERAIAAATVREGHACTAEELIALARSKLADYKVPSEIVFDLGPLPRNAMGKINKAAIRSRYLTRTGEIA